MSDAVAFYCVCDERYFLGAVGMINSLRLLGHTEPIFVLDLGLSRRQREQLEPHVTLLRAPAKTPPYLLKTIAPARHPAQVMVLIDADMVVTRPLTELIETATSGRVVAFRDGADRFVPEWGELLGLGRAQPRPYVCSGLVVAGGPVGRELLSLMDEGQRRVAFERTYYGDDSPGYPFRFPEQDVLNAILCSRMEADQLEALDERLSPTPPFTGLTVIDERALRCEYDDGVEPYVLHHHGPKPWLDRLHHGVYSRLLRRLLIGPGLAAAVPEGELPLRFRTGVAAYAERKRVNTRWLYRWYVRGRPVVSPIDPMR